MLEGLPLGCFPIAYQVKKVWPVEQQLIVVNWLAQEATSIQTQIKYPILQLIRGWRNRECYETVHSRDWTAILYQG